MSESMSPEAEGAFATGSPFQPLAARARTAMRLGALLLSVPLVLPVAGISWLLTVQRDELGAGAWLALVALYASVVVAACVAFASARWRRTGWRLERDGLMIRRGVFWRSETLVPRSRVQHVDLLHGPIDRRFGLAELKVHTAGTRLASVALAGLEQARAAALRDALVEDSADTDAELPAAPAPQEPGDGG